MKQYAEQHYMSYSKVLFFALKEKYERELGSKEDVEGLKASNPTARPPPRTPTTTTPISRQQPDAEDPTNTRADVMSTTGGSSRVVQPGGSGDDVVVAK